jgi:hypothetical protein
MAAAVAAEGLSVDSLLDEDSPEELASPEELVSLSSSSLLPKLQAMAIRSSMIIIKRTGCFFIMFLQ